MDLLFWSPELHPCPRKDQERSLDEVLAAPDFLLEGGFPWTYPARIARSDTLIWLDIPPHQRIYNIVKRHWFEGRPVGQHQVDFATRDRTQRPGFLRHLREEQPNARELLPVFANPPAGKRLVRLHDRVAARAFLDGLPK
jgi:hypothetical protein